MAGFWKSLVAWLKTDSPETMTPEQFQEKAEIAREAGTLDEETKAQLDAMKAEIAQKGSQILADLFGPEARFVAGLEPLVNGVNFSSSNVQEIFYDFPASAMIITYKDERKYKYWTVTEAEARQFFQAASKGKTVWDVFRVRGSATQHKKSYVQI